MLSENSGLVFVVVGVLFAFRLFSADTWVVLVPEWREVDSELSGPGASGGGSWQLSWKTWKGFLCEGGSGGVGVSKAGSFSRHSPESPLPAAPHPKPHSWCD